MKLKDLKEKYASINLNEHYASIKDTQEFDRRVDEGKKTTLDFASQYVYYYGNQAGKRFVEECFELETAFFYEVVVLINVHLKIQEILSRVGGELESLELYAAALAYHLNKSTTENN